MGRIVLVEISNTKALDEFAQVSAQTRKGDKVITYYDLSSGVKLLRFENAQPLPHDEMPGHPTQYRIEFQSIGQGNHWEELYFSDQNEVDKFFETWTQDARLIHVRSYAELLYNNDPEQFRSVIKRVTDENTTDPIIKLLRAIGR